MAWLPRLLVVLVMLLLGPHVGKFAVLSLPPRTTSVLPLMPVQHATTDAAEFRQQMVDLVRSGRAPEDLAREFEPSAQAIRTWVAQAGRDAGERSDGLRTEEREELRRLRRENRRLREEREILAKATAWFAREARPGRPTGS